MPPPTKKLKKSEFSTDTSTTSIGKYIKDICTHLALFIVVVVYAVAGAYLLISIESPGEEERWAEKKEAGQMLESSKEYITSLAWYHTGKNETHDEYVPMMTKNLDLFHRFVVSKALNSYYDGYPDQWDADWTIPKSLLFTVTTMGAIGYGHIAPKSSFGRIFTMYYGMIGVPLFLIFLATIGDNLAKAFKYTYSRICCRMCRVRRKITEVDGPDKLDKKSLWNEKIGSEEYMPTDKLDVPITVNLLVIFVYLIMGGALFSFWENWSISEAVYFTFITLTTIGFGDYVPGKSFKASGKNAFTAALKMMVTILFCVFGMALLSMAINLMQEQIVAKVRWLANEIGVGKKETKTGKQYKVKVSEEGSVATTPADRDGNKNKNMLLNMELSEAKKKPQFNKYNMV